MVYIFFQTGAKHSFSLLVRTFSGQGSVQASLDRLDPILKCEMGLRLLWE